VIDSAPGVKIDGIEIDKEVQSLTDNMNRATATLQLGSSESASKEGGQGDDTNDIYYHTESDDPSYHTEDDSYDNPNEHDIDPEDYDEALEVSSGELDAVHANRFQAPGTFRQQLWNNAGPTIDSMMVQLTMIKDNLEDDEAGLPFEWMGVSTELRTFLDEEVGDGISAQLIYINNMLAEMYEMNPTGVWTFDPLNMEPDDIPKASKTQESPPGAQEARPADKAAAPARSAGRDKEGVLSLGMATGD
jgi:hypothetical protein